MWCVCVCVCVMWFWKSTFWGTTLESLVLAVNDSENHLFCYFIPLRLMFFPPIQIDMRDTLC